MSLNLFVAVSRKLKGNIIDSTQLSCTEVLVVAKFKKMKFAYDNYFFSNLHAPDIHI